MKLVVGLGNPGNQYAETRHNIGWMVLDRIADRAGRAGRGRQRDASRCWSSGTKGLELRAGQAPDLHERLRARGPQAARAATACRWSTCSSSPTTSRCRSASCGSARPGRTAGTTACARSSTSSTPRSSAACGSGSASRGAARSTTSCSRFHADETRPHADPPRRRRGGDRGVGPRRDLQGRQPVQRVGAPGARAARPTARRRPPARRGGRPGRRRRRAPHEDRLAADPAAATRSGGATQGRRPR